MATTNTNTNSETVLSSDIYEIADFYNHIREETIPDVDDTASMVGIFGYMTEMFSQTMQNTLITVSETTNETIPTRAKFSKNVISHALNYGITDINAKPAVMTMMIYLPLNYFDSNLVERNDDTGKGKFILSSKIPFFIDDFEYHLDYDVIINRIRNSNNEYIYTAMYDLYKDNTNEIKQLNPLSDISDPWIITLVQYKIDSTDYIAFSARLHQVSYVNIQKPILTSNDIENKSITFDFDDQLASFSVDIIEDNVTTHLTPIYDGLLDYTIQDGSWCYYSYVGSNTIRIIFSRDSYIPKLNAIVSVNIWLSTGAAGNFTYNQPFRTSLQSDEYNNYNGMYALVYPLLQGVSSGGKDKKSISDLKKIIPREASSRGAIINTTDLQNFFNSINDMECKIHFKKKRDNPFERLYYAYMLMRKDANVYPTNTISLKIEQDDFVGTAGNNNLSINPGTVFYYYNHGSDELNDFASISCPKLYNNELDDENIDYPVTINSDGDYVRVYKYISPFLITIDEDLLSYYFLTLMNEMKTFRFESINRNTDLQFISTNMIWNRNFYYLDENYREYVYDNKYTIKLDITQNIQTNSSDDDYTLVTTHQDSNGNLIFDEVKIKVYIVFYADETDKIPYKYAEGQLTEYDDDGSIYGFTFTFETDDLMDLNNRINIKGVYNAKPEGLQRISQIENSHGYMNKNTFARIFILADFGITDDIINDRGVLENAIPNGNYITEQLLKNNLYIIKDNQTVDIVSVIKNNESYINRVTDYNNDELRTTEAILKYLTANKTLSHNSNNEDYEFIYNTLLKDPNVLEIIDSYSYEDLSKYTLCNVLSVDGGIDFYHDYSNLMRSTINVTQIPERDNEGNIIYREIQRSDVYGNEYTEYQPVYKTNQETNRYYYNYTISRIPVVKEGWLNTEELVQNFISDIEERRIYIEECLYVLEDTFDIDFKFVNTYGPSKTFYYNIPTSQNYKITIQVKQTNVYRNLDEENIVGILKYGQEVIIVKTSGQWGYITTPYEGWVRLSDGSKKVSFIDNVAINLKFALEAQTSADKYISNNIISDIKEYIEDINEINELHIPNIITLITNNYREQLVYFEFLDVNNYGAMCQHLYLYERDPDIADIAPEFINVATSEDGLFTPLIDITVF